MTEEELKIYILANYRKENDYCEWKEFKNLKGNITGSAGNDVATYVSAIANVNGGHIVVGVIDGSLDIVGIQKFSDYTKENVCPRLVGFCAHLNSEAFKVEEFITTDSKKVVWVFHVPKHFSRTPVYAHGHPWQRVGDQLSRMRPERLAVILSEPLDGLDWSAVVIDKATIRDLDEDAINTARLKFKEKNQRQPWSSQIDGWSDITFLDKAGLNINGGTTRAAILLIGKQESAHHMSPHPAQITWKLMQRKKHTSILDRHSFLRRPNFYIEYVTFLRSYFLIINSSLMKY